MLIEESYTRMVLLSKIRELTDEEKVLMQTLKDLLQKKFDENED